MKRELASQYGIALTMLKGVLQETSERLWAYTDDRKEAVWHIAYHAIYFANAYSSPSEEEVTRWKGQSNDAQFLGPTPWPPHERHVPKETFTKAQIEEYIDFVRGLIPSYLDHFDAEKPCWPNWYNMNQFEFHLNNLRHIQHHTAQIIERNGGTKVGWLGVE